MSWQSLPAELILTDNKVRKLTLQETEFYFKKANRLGVLDQFTEVFWNAVRRIQSDNGHMQEVVNLLEDQKRSIGRQYDRAAHKKFVSDKDTNAVTQAHRTMLALKYNDLEDQIQWLIEQYDVYRHSKPYKLDINGGTMI